MVQGLGFRGKGWFRGFEVWGREAGRKNGLSGFHDHSSPAQLFWDSGHWGVGGLGLRDLQDVLLPTMYTA